MATVWLMATAWSALSGEDATVEQMVRTGLRTGVLRKDGNVELQRVFEKDVLPRTGSKPVRATTEQDLRDVLAAVVERGANRLAVTMSRDIRQVFAWAEKRQPWRRLLLDGNPAELVCIETVVARTYDLSNIRSRTLSADEVRELRDIFMRMAAAYESAGDKRSVARPVQLETQCALWICLATTCRIGALMMARWADVDLEVRRWSMPKENTKGSRGTTQDQLVLLCDFARKQFQELHGLTGHTPWCFPSRDGTTHIDIKTVTKQVGDRQHQFKDRQKLKGRRNDNSLVLASGAKGEWTPHDLRRTAATMMQALGAPPDVIDRCQKPCTRRPPRATPLPDPRVHGREVRRLAQAWRRTRKNPCCTPCDVSAAGCADRRLWARSHRSGLRTASLGFASRPIQHWRWPDGRTHHPPTAAAG